MNILTVENMTKAYGERKLFSNASFFLEEGEKAGIIGINGTGKSTLLKIIAGLEEPDEGRVIMANHCMVRFLPQNPRFGEKETVLEAVLRGNTKEENENTTERRAVRFCVFFLLVGRRASTPPIIFYTVRDFYEYTRTIFQRRAGLLPIYVFGWLYPATDYVCRP